MGHVVKVRQSLLPFLIAADVWVLRLFVASARTASGRRLAVAVSRIGNGGLYPALAALMILGCGARGCYVMIAAAVNVGLMHSVYPTIKRRAARQRPFQAHSDLKPLLATLDEHSFPSGHVMTLTAALVPIVVTISARCRFRSRRGARWPGRGWRLRTIIRARILGAAIALVVSYPLSHYGLAGALPG